MGRRRRDGNYSPQKNNSIQDSLGNEENGYLVPDLNKTMTNVTKELSEAHTQNKTRQNKTLKEEISEKFMETLLNMVNQNVQDALKKFQDAKNKEHEMTQKQIKELERTSTNIKVKQRILKQRDS
jgi:uncharacterized protein involved in exopolysaccharide biosynthesis